MKTTLFLVSCLLFAPQAFSQSHARKKVYRHQSSDPSAETGKMLCKAWVLDSVEQFSVTQKASPKEINDELTLMADGTFFITSEGVASTGKWTGNAHPFIYAATGTPAVKKMYKIISLSDNRLVLEYQSPDLVRTHYIYSPKK